MATTAPASPPPRRRLAGWLGLMAFGVALVGVAAAAAPWLFSTNMLQRDVLAQIRQTTGLITLSQGHSVFVVLPQPHISIDDIRFADPSGALSIDAKSLKGYLRVAALLRGRLEVGSTTLVEPRIALDLDGAAMPQDSAIGRAAQAKSSSPQAGSADSARLGVISIIDGGARLTSRGGRSEIALDNINVTVDWRELGAPARLDGTLRFRGQGANISAVLARPTELLRGEQSPLTLKIDGPALSLSAGGALSQAPGARFVGRLAAAAPSLRKLVETGGYFVDLPAPFEDFALTADASIGADSASFSGLNLQLDGNVYEGAMAVIMGEGRPVLSGTLAADALSLRPFLVDRAPVLVRDGQWSHDPFDLEAESFADLDLRVSAGRLILPGAEFADAAFSVMSRKDRLDLALIEARAYSGALKGRATFSRGEAGLDLRASAVATDIDVAAVWPSSIEAWRVAGALSASGAIESVGDSASELMRNLAGQAQVALERGDISGLNLDQALRWIDKRPLGIADEFHYGGTAFDRVAFGLRIAHGVAEIEPGALMRSRSLNLAFGGAVDIGERALDVRATATAAGSEPKPGREPAKFDFDVAGSWDDIALVPDARSLIRQSGAAAPLFAPPRLDVKAAPPPGGER